MQKHRIEKYDLIGIVLGLLLIALMALLLYFCVMSFEIQHNTAYADSTDGVVEDNFLTNSYFLDSSTWGFANNASLLSLNPLKFTSSTDWGQCFSSLPTSYYNSTLTFSIYARVVSGTGALNFRYRVGSSGGTTGTANTIYFTNTEFQVISYTFDFSTLNFTSLNYLVCAIYTRYANSVVEIRWAKVELGSSFTGYVPNDYTNYGYNQGYSAGFTKGVSDTQAQYNAIRGFEIPDSTSYYLNNNVLSDNALSIYQNGSLTTYFDNKIFFNYLNNDYLLAPAPTGNIHSYGSVVIPQGSLTYTLSSSGVSSTSFATFPVALHIGYIDGPAYFRTELNLSQNDLRIIIRRSDGTQTIFVDNYIISAYYNNLPVMDLSQYLTGGFYYDFYLSRKTAGQNISLQMNNTYYNGINSTCIVKVLNDDVLGQSAYEEGRIAGYDAGKSAGYWEGYGDGYSQGELVAPADGQYSFLGVIGALFDAPIGALRNFLDFDLLGFNMKSFVFAMLTLAFIVLIIRLILGSKS